MTKRLLTAPIRDEAATIDGKAQALAYFRVSTAEQANTSYDEDGFSILAQREYCQRKAGEIGAVIVDEFVDRGKSARTAARPELQALLKRIQEDPDIQYVIVHKLDRLARNRADDIELNLFFAKHGVRLISATENIDDSPTGKLVHGIMSDIAEFYSANLSEEAKKGLRKKVEYGGTPGKVPVGYKNARDTRDGKNIGIVVVVEAYAAIVQRLFELYDTGRYTLSDLADEANHLGLRMAATKTLPERPLMPQTVQKILRNPYYAGYVSYHGVQYNGDHEAIVEEPLFDRVQALLTARNLNKDKSKTRPHHLKGNIFCARCGRRLGITAPTNQYGSTYGYFYCLGRQKDKNACPQGYVPIGTIERAVRDYWTRVHLPSERIQVVRQMVIESFAGKHAQAEGEIDKQKARLKSIERLRLKNKDAYYADAIGLEEFKADQARFSAERKAAEGIISRLSVELDSIRGSLDEVVTLLEHPQALYEAMPEGMKQILVQTVFEKLWILDDTVAGSELTAPFEEVLTLEAKLARVERHKDESKAQGGSEGSGIGETTYHREANGFALMISELEADWPRLQVERPNGPLPVDKAEAGVMVADMAVTRAVAAKATKSQNSAPLKGARSSDVHHLVGLTGFEPATP
jgi:site-specific DNA recombinase